MRLTIALGFDTVNHYMTVYLCELCGLSFQTPIQRLGHDYVSHIRPLTPAQKLRLTLGVDRQIQLQFKTAIKVANQRIVEHLG